MKEKIVNNLTYKEKIIMLYNYCDKNSYNENLAKNMSSIIYKAVKLSDQLALEVIDDILDKYAVIRTMPYTPTKTATLTPLGPKVLAYFKPTIVSFIPDKLAFEKVDILTRYINHEVSKKEQNTSNYSIKD